MIRIPFDKKLHGELEADEEVELMALATLSPDGKFLLINDVEGSEPEYVEDEEEDEEEEEIEEEDTLPEEEKALVKQMLPSF